jgi:hypothetical protein
MTPRNDVHQPANIVPEDYQYLFSYSYPGPGYNMALLEAVRTGQTQHEPIYGVVNGQVVPTGYTPVNSRWGKLPFFQKTTGSETGCSICGAHYRHGDAWLHRPTGEVVLIGHMCADKMGTVPARGEWTAHQKAIARLKKTAEYQRLRMEREVQKAASGAGFLLANPGLEEALSTDHYICRDLRAKLAQYGSLSAAQINLARKLAAEAATPAEEKPKVVMPPSGRVQLEGIILSLKEHEGAYGFQMKMLVEVTTPAGCFRVFGTRPTASVTPSKGSRIRFNAMVQPKEPGFGYFSKPTSAEVIGGAA